MLEYEKRIKEVKDFLDSKDRVLGYRKLMDCAIDTQDLSIYKEIIELTDWKEKFPLEEEKLIEKATVILNEISQISIEEFPVDKPVVKTTNIIKSYGKNKFSLGPISLEIKKREVYGLVGENGNGKTTLLRILAKELYFDEGQIDFLR
ncbi:MAG: ATP-binding cassette domain-containing protein [Flavobacteriaceae bacterium]|nr:ATP-binding cassette domain-containing protein [Flavobacteriaceae bacterium]